MSRIGWDLDEPEIDVPTEDPGIRSRLNLFRIILLLAIGILLYRVIYLQQIGGAEFQALAEENRFATLPISSPRGVIFDRNGLPLADNVPSFNVTITPAFLPEDDAERMAVFQRLSLLTGVPITNTAEQQSLIAEADPELVSQYTRLAGLYGAPVSETLDLSSRRCRTTSR